MAEETITPVAESPMCPVGGVGICGSCGCDE